MKKIENKSILSNIIALSYAILQSIDDTLKDSPEASQRTIAKNAKLSVGMMNTIFLVRQDLSKYDLSKCVRFSTAGEAFDGGVYHTGDNVYMDEDGYVWFVGRKDDIIKTAGYRVSPFEVESILQQHPAVLECAVTGVEDAKRGMSVKATIVLSPGYENRDPKEMEIELSTFAKENTAMYKCPRIFEFVKELPKTISGKIRRVEIREKDNGKDKDKIRQEF